MNKRILFLTLRIFSATGGIEKVCRIFGMALNEIAATEGGKIDIFSLHDATEQVNEKYIPSKKFRGFKGQKISFILNALNKGNQSAIIVVSHINLLSVAYLIKFFFPKKKLLLFAHGIEVWGQLSFTRKRMLKACDMILAVSSFTKEKLKEKGWIDPDKIIVLNNCIDPYLQPLQTETRDAGLLAKYNFIENNIILLTLTRLSSKELYKGYDNVLNSVAALKEKFPQIKYLIVGRYDVKEKQRLDKIIEKHNLKEQVFFTGYIPDDQLAKHYGLADMYVMPSKKEGFGIVFIEALYYGLPVIAGNKDGSVDALCNGKLGVLINPDDQDELNNAIEKVILDKDSYKPDMALLNQLFSYNSYKEKCTGILALH